MTHEPTNTAASDAKPLPPRLIEIIGSYGLLARNGSEVERLHMWQLLLDEIKSYAAAGVPELSRQAAIADGLVAERDRLAEKVRIIEAAMLARVTELKAERDHWKANHDNQVARARVLLERTDLPLERIAAYEQIGQLRNECSQLREALIDMLSGWRYIREVHGELHGVGWDRAESKAVAAIDAASK